MKKFLFVLSAVVLAVFMAGCGKTPDDELTEKVPATADGLCFIDGVSLTKTQLYKEHQKDIQEGLKSASLKEEFLQCRILFFGSSKEEWGGVLVQSTGGQVRKFFDWAVAECKKENAISDLKETSEGTMRKVTGRVEETKVLVVLYHDDLLLLAADKTDPAFFNARSANPLIRKINLKSAVISAAAKVELPKQGKGKEAVDEALQMFPVLKKLQFVALTVPFSPDKLRMDFYMIFPDDASAGEMLAVVNMGAGMLAKFLGKEAEAVTQLIDRKTEKNALRISFAITELAKLAEDAAK